MKPLAQSPAVKSIYVHSGDSRLMYERILGCKNQKICDKPTLVQTHPDVQGLPGNHNKNQETQNDASNTANPMQVPKPSMF